MAVNNSPKLGDVYSIVLDPGRDEKDSRFFVVITPAEINSLGITMMVPVLITKGFNKQMGLMVPLMVDKTTGVAICNQVRSFDVQSRVQMGTARYVESLEKNVSSEIVSRVLSVIEPAAPIQ